MMSRNNTWVNKILEWGQAAVDGKPIWLDQDGREHLFVPVLESLYAKEYKGDLDIRIPGERLIIVPLSGGLDSLVAYSRAVESGEETRAYYVALNSTYREAELHALSEMGMSFRYLDYSFFPQGWKPYETSWAHIMPLRNLLVICAIAESVSDRSGKLWLGATEGEIPDQGGDKSLRFFEATSFILDSFPIKHKLQFPLRYETKTDLVTWWLETNHSVDILLKSITCQDPTPTFMACGACHACFNRWVAFRNNDLKEPMVTDPKSVQKNADKVEQFRAAMERSDYSTWSRRRMEQTLSAWSR